MKPRRLAARLALVVLLLGAFGRAQPVAPARLAGGAVSFALLGDPQIGYGLGGDLADGGRFREVLDTTVGERFAFLVIAGDLTQDRGFWQHWIFEASLRHAGAKPLLVAGNHDVTSERSLSAYRAKYGADFYRYAVGGTTILVLNSETLRTPAISLHEFDDQWRWFERTLAQEPSTQRVFLVAHRPPFRDSEDEGDSSGTWPRPTRARLLENMRRHHVTWFLAGHLHERHAVTTSDGIHVVVEPGSARSFDASPIGYRSFRVDGDRVDERFVKVLDAPRPPFRVPGFDNWTPRLFDFSVRHWLFTLGYLAVAALALRTARIERRQAGGTPLGMWGGIAAVLVFFGLNMQLDIDELLQDIGRAGARAVGILPIRHLITGSGLLLGTGAAVWWLGRRFLAARRDRGATFALAALGVPAAWFCLSTISHHDLRMVFPEETWDLLTIAAFVVIGVAAVRAARRASGAAATAVARRG